jgi:hypothetical protein
MTGSRESWTTHDLELFADERFDSERVSQLTDDLRRDAALRTRLAQVRRTDEVLRAALLQPRPITKFSGAPVLRRSLAAASVLLFVGVTGWLVWGRTGGAPLALSGLATTNSTRAVRIVFSIPLSTESVLSSQKVLPGQSSTSAQDERALLSQIRLLLAAGQAKEAVELLTGTAPDGRRLDHRYLSEFLQSAQVAELLLDGLNLNEQVTVCGEWASEPAIRPMVFARLRRLSEEPSVSSEVGSVLADLAADPELRAWIRGYQLLERS